MPRSHPDLDVCRTARLCEFGPAMPRYVSGKCMLNLEREHVPRQCITGGALAGQSSLALDRRFVGAESERRSNAATRHRKVSHSRKPPLHNVQSCHTCMPRDITRCTSMRARTTPSVDATPHRSSARRGSQNPISAHMSSRHCVHLATSA